MASWKALIGGCGRLFQSQTSRVFGPRSKQKKLKCCILVWPEQLRKSVSPPGSLRDHSSIHCTNVPNLQFSHGIRKNACKAVKICRVQRASLEQQTRLLNRFLLLHLPSECPNSQSNARTLPTSLDSTARSGIQTVTMKQAEPALFLMI